MIDRSRFSLNRILLPEASLEDFFRFTADLGLHKVELRNDLPGKGIIDDHSPEQVRQLCETYGMVIRTINALQKFNLGRILTDLLVELEGLIALSQAIGCEAIVLVPTNDPGDKRSADMMMHETVKALKAFAPLLVNSGLLGYIEPLGFEACSLRSKTAALDAIRKSGCGSCYKIVHDTFHHHLGPDAMETLESAFDVAFTGLVHVSGVEQALPVHDYRDGHRVLIGGRDFLESRRQVEQLVAWGYTGDISFEPFAREIQAMDAETLKSHVDQSIRWLTTRSS